jgi:hypothetical protein
MTTRDDHLGAEMDDRSAQNNAQDDHLGVILGARKRPGG